MTLYKLHVTIWLTNQGIIEVLFRDGLLVRTTGKESQDVRNSAWRSLLVLEIPSTWFLKSMQTTRWHITFFLLSEWLDRRLGWEIMFLLWRRWRPTATKTSWMLLTSPLGYENVYILNDLTKIFRSFVPSHLESLGTLSGLATDLKQLALALPMLSELISMECFGSVERIIRKLSFKLVLTSKNSRPFPYLFYNSHRHQGGVVVVHRVWQAVVEVVGVRQPVDQRCHWQTSFCWRIHWVESHK